METVTFSSLAKCQEMLTALAERVEGRIRKGVCCTAQ
jgi:hypothetical protein